MWSRRWTFLLLIDTAILTSKRLSHFILPLHWKQQNFFLLSNLMNETWSIIITLIFVHCLLIRLSIFLHAYWSVLFKSVTWLFIFLPIFLYFYFYYLFLWALYILWVIFIYYVACKYFTSDCCSCFIYFYVLELKIFHITLIKTYPV